MGHAAASGLGGGHDMRDVFISIVTDDNSCDRPLRCSAQNCSALQNPSRFRIRRSPETRITCKSSRVESPNKYKGRCILCY
jgi:hypothetical protein